MGLVIKGKDCGCESRKLVMGAGSNWETDAIIIGSIVVAAILLGVVKVRSNG